MKPERLIAVAVDCENMALAYLADDACTQISFSRKAARELSRARSELRLAIARFVPDCIVLMDPDARSTKGRQTLGIVRGLRQAVQDEGGALISPTDAHIRQSGWRNRKRLAERFPAVAGELPPERRYPHKASKREVAVEALAMLALVYEHQNQRG